jgi:alpha-glucoside transport system permease protein
MSRRSVVAAIGTHSSLVVVIAIWLIPVAGLLVSSFRTPQDVNASGWWKAFVPPYRFTTQNYAELFESGGLVQAGLNSFAITVPATLFTVVIGAMAGFAFARWRFPGRDALFVTVLVLLSVPIQLTLVPVLRLFVDFDVVGTLPAVWVAHVGYSLPFAIYLMRNFFAGLPDSLFEAAAVDGASELRTFVSLGLPLAAPALASVAVFEFLAIWNDLLVALIYLGGAQQVAPLTVAVSGLVNSRGEGWQTLTAAAFILMIVPMVVFFALQRYFVRGLLAGAVK